MKRPHTLDPTTAVLTELRGDEYPPTNRGISLAVIEKIDDVDHAEAATIGDNRAVIWVTLARPWWWWLALGYMGRKRRQVRRLVNRYGAANVAFQIRFI